MFFFVFFFMFFIMFFSWIFLSFYLISSLFLLYRLHIPHLYRENLPRSAVPFPFPFQKLPKSSNFRTPYQHFLRSYPFRHKNEGFPSESPMRDLQNPWFFFEFYGKNPKNETRRRDFGFNL